MERSGTLSAGSTISPLQVELEPTLPSFQKHVGITGVGFCFVSLVIGGGQIYIAAELTDYFYDFRASVWPFLALAFGCIAVPSYNLIRWKMTLRPEIVHKSGYETNDLELGATGKLKGLIDAIMNINGSLFLWKLHFMAAMCVMTQAYILLTVHSCALPTYALAMFYMSVITQCFYQAYNLFKPNNPKQRFKLATVIFCAQIVYLTVPLLFIWFAFKIPLHETELLILTAWPTISTLVSIDELFEQIVLQNHATFMLSEQKRVSHDKSRRRSSLFEAPWVIKQAKEQEKRFPSYARHAFGSINGCLAMSLLVTICFQVSIFLHCNGVLWESCNVKVPFCASVFSYTCNCAVITIERHNLTVLPDEFNEMTALRSIVVRRGPLKKLPDLSKCPNLSVINVKENLLTDISEILMAKQLTTVDVSMNRVETLPHGLDSLKRLFKFFAKYNQIQQIPKGFGVGYRYIFLNHNNLTHVPSEESFWRSIVVLGLGDNRIDKLPESIKASRLSVLEIRGNNISSLPYWVGASPRLTWLDARHNNLVALPNKLLHLKYIWVAGNPLCTNNWFAKETQNVGRVLEHDGMGCTQQCSRTCNNKWKSDTFCDIECNSAQCGNDGGDCKHND
jgi:hypothetical protein